MVNVSALSTAVGLPLVSSPAAIPLFNRRSGNLRDQIFFIRKHELFFYAVAVIAKVFTTLALRPNRHLIAGRHRLGSIERDAYSTSTVLSPWNLTPFMPLSNT